MKAQFDEYGRQIPDSTPVDVPLQFKRPLTIEERIQNGIRTYMSSMAVQEGKESFEEANDFDVDDDEGDFLSQYEMTDMQAEYPVSMMKKRPNHPHAKPISDQVEKNEQPLTSSGEVSIPDTTTE